MSSGANFYCQFSHIVYLFTPQQTGKFTEKQPFALDTDFGAFCAQGSACCKTSDCSCLQSQQTKKKTLRRLGNRCHGSECFEVFVFLNQRASGSGGMVPGASSEDSTTTSSSTVSPLSDSTSKDPKSMVPNGTFSDVSCGRRLLSRSCTWVCGVCSRRLALRFGKFGWMCSISAVPQLTASVNGTHTDLSVGVQVICCATSLAFATSPFNLQPP